MSEPSATGAPASEPAHPLVVAVTPLLERIGAELVGPDEAEPSDVPLVWAGQTVALVRVAAGRTDTTGEAVADLDLLLDEVSRVLGGPLSELSRPDKQQAVRLLEERGAFRYRRSAESVAEALGVTRFTVYNYLNRGRA